MSYSYYAFPRPVSILLTATVSGVPTGACSGPSPKNTTGQNCAGKGLSAAQSYAADSVNTATGNFNEFFEDFAIAGRGPGLRLNHSYNSLQAAVNGPLGFGWASSYGAKVNVVAGVATVHQETGAEVAFYPSGTGFEAPVWANATLLGHANGYTFTRCNLTTMEFGTNGQLLSIADRNGHRTTLQYLNGRLATVTDSAGRQLAFTWTGDHITSVSSAGRSVAFAYDANGDLTDYVDANDGAWRFTYQGHLLKTMRRPGQAGVVNPAVVTNVYDTGGRVTSQTDELQRLTTLN